MKQTHQRGARWVQCYPLPHRRLIPTLWEGTNARPASAGRLVERMRTREWNARRGK